MNVSDYTVNLLQGDESRSWYAEVRKHYAHAVSAWNSVSGAKSDAIRFWELGLSLDEYYVKAGAQALADSIQTGASAPSRESCLLLFYILRSRLTNVAGNRLWPEVASLLTQLSGREVDVNRCAGWFRIALDKAFPGPLGAARIHNRFVVHAFDEAGVGRDRNNQEARFVEHGPLLGNIVAYPTNDAPFTYFVEVYKRISDDEYSRVLSYRGKTGYGDGNRLAVIDSEMPEILRRLSLWKTGDPLPVPPRTPGGCTRLVMRKGVEWCDPY